MFAIIEASGKQYWVEPNKFYDFNNINVEVGGEITLNRVLLLKNGNKILIGQPILKNVLIKGSVIRELLGGKIVIYKMKPKKKTRKKAGFRQKISRVKIEQIRIKN
jgi:large subunit ribosomal protein L21